MKDKTSNKRFAYLAGLIDGDGSISIRYDKRAGYQLTYSVYSTSLSLTNRLVEMFGGNYRKLPTTGNRKQKYCWYGNKPKTLLNFAPFLIIKNKQGKIAVDFILLGSVKNPEARQDLTQDLQNANSSFVPLDRPHILSFYGVSYPTETDICYLAGLVDAEGSFTLQKRKQSGNGSYTSYMRVSNTDGIVFPWLISKFKGRFSETNRGAYRREGTWTLSGENREKCLLAIIPYLIIKKERAIMILEWIRKNHMMSSDEKLSFYLKMKTLNQRGKSPEANMSSISTEMKIESDPCGDVGSGSVVIPTP